MHKSVTIVAMAAVMFSLAGVAQADTFGTGENQFTIDFVPISGDSGDLGNWPASPLFTFTGVNRSDYRMGTFEVTNDQWNKFRAAYGPVTGTPPVAYAQDAQWTGTQAPTNQVSWYEAAQFVNWLNVSSGHHVAYNFTGTQGQSDYAFDVWSPAEADQGTNLYRHKDAFYYLPTEAEWVKAAYWNGESLQTWATPDDSAPLAGEDSNFDNVIGQPWDVGKEMEELNGTFDMMGNVHEWMESPWDHPGYPPDAARATRGGAYSGGDHYLSSGTRDLDLPLSDNSYLGFRVTANVPEPCTLGLLSLGALMILKRKRR